MFDFAVIGDPISHSLSPRIHTAMLKELGLDLKYGSFFVAKNKVSEWLQSPESKALRGYNITMPHKHEIMHSLNVLSKEVQAIQAVNTVVRRKDGLYGYNTDCLGFIRSLLTCNENPMGKRVLLLGKGGASKALIYGLQEQGAKITLAYRNAQQKTLEQRTLQGGKETSTQEILKTCEKIDWNYFEDLLPSTDILINATPLGMEGTKEDFNSFDFLAKLPHTSLVCDLIYKPHETALLAHAKKEGLRTINGLGMLVHQAIAALELFLDTELDYKTMEKVVYTSLKDLLL